MPFFEFKLTCDRRKSEKNETNEISVRLLDLRRQGGEDTKDAILWVFDTLYWCKCAAIL